MKTKVLHLHEETKLLNKFHYTLNNPLLHKYILIDIKEQTVNKNMNALPRKKSEWLRNLRWDYSLIWTWPILKMVIHVHIYLNSKTFIVLMYTLVIVQKTKQDSKKFYPKFSVFCIFKILTFEVIV